MDGDNVDYLQAGFDPKTLTMPRLRSILVTHNVQYPATAKKSQLVELFEKEVVPLAKQYLAARARAKRSSKGIENAETQSTTSTDFEKHEDDMVPPPQPRRERSPRKTTRLTADSESHDETISAAPRTSPRKRQARSASVQAPSDNDTGPDAEVERPRRRGRPTTTAAALVAPKLEPPEEEQGFFKRTPETASAFTSENPFQSGSSPTEKERTPSTRRKTTYTETAKANTKAPTGSRRRIDGPICAADEHETGDGVDATLAAQPAHWRPKRSVAQSASYGATRPPQTPESAADEPGEEFTPAEQESLKQDGHARPELAVVGQESRRESRGRSLKSPFYVVLFTLLATCAGWYRQEKIRVGYCGIGQRATQLVPSIIPLPAWVHQLLPGQQNTEIAVPNWLVTAMEPECEPCPLHGRCYADYSVRCDVDFVLKSHPLSLRGLVPLSPTCEPDGERVRRVHSVADKAVEELRERRAKYECNEPVDGDGHVADTPMLDEQELKEVVSKQRKRRMDAAEFEDLWTAAIGEVQAREEVVVEQTPAPDSDRDSSSFPSARLSSTSLARLSYPCQAKRAIRHGLARYRVSIAGLVIVLVAVLYLRSSIRERCATNAQIPGLVDDVLEALSTQKEIAFEGGSEDAFLFLPNLRDHVLRSMHKLKQRERVWQKVRAVVEQNSNVRTGQREGRNGEVGRAWEWIGPARAALGDARRRQRRGPSGLDGDVVNAAEEGQKVMARKSGSVTSRKWDQSRPAY